MQLLNSQPKRRHTNCMHRARKLQCRRHHHIINLIIMRASVSWHLEKVRVTSRKRALLTRRELQSFEVVCVSLRQRETNKFTTAVGKRAVASQDLRRRLRSECVFPDVQKDRWAGVIIISPLPASHESSDGESASCGRTDCWDAMGGRPS
jgi:hypothetical protein